jgi:hypothetical protein
VSTPAERLTREADDIRALAGEHGAETEMTLIYPAQYALVELVLRIVARALADDDEEREAA